MEKIKENKNEIVKLYNDGKSIRKIAKNYGISYSTLNRYIKSLSDKETTNETQYSNINDNINDNITDSQDSNIKSNDNITYSQSETIK